MADTSKDRPPDKAADRSTQAEAPGHRHEHKERVFEDGQDAHNDARPSRENLSGTPPGSDPRE